MSECNCKEEINALRESLLGEINELKTVLKFFLAEGVSSAPEKTTPSRQVSVLGDAAILKMMTSKQHAAMQMWLLAGMNITEISKRMQCVPNTARHHLRGLWTRLDTNDKDQIAARLLPILDEVSDAEYLKWSGGLPKGWAAGYIEGEDDPYARLYIKARGVIDGGET